MTIFKRELLSIIRTKVFLIVLPLTAILSSLTFSKEIIDIKFVYSLFPLVLAIFIPILSINIWQREKSNGFVGQIKRSVISIKKVVFLKFCVHLLIFLLLQVIVLPLIYAMSLLGFVDYGQLLAINLGIFVFVILGLSITFFYSVIINGRILGLLLSGITLFIIAIKSQLLTLSITGVIELGYLLLYLIFSCLFLTISIYIIGKNHNFIHYLILLFFIFFSLFISIRIDFTSLKSHTLNSFTVDYISQSISTVQIEYYYSNSLNKRDGVPGEVLPILDQFHRLDKVNVSIISDSQIEFAAAVNTYNPITLDEEGLYNFLVIKYLNKYKVIPYIPSTQTLEFEILKVVTYLKNNGLKKIGLLLGNEEFSKENFTVLEVMLRENFSLSYLSPGDHISKDFDSLIILGHYNISYNNIYEIGEYLENGGNVLFAGTGLPTANNLEYRPTPILESLNSLGIKIEKYLIGDKNNVGIVNKEGSLKSYPLNVITRPNRALTNNSIVYPFMGFVGVYLSPILLENSNFSEILFSSKESWLVDSTTGLDGTPENSYPVAVYGEGNFSKYFTNKSSDKANRILVIGNSISFTDYLSNIGIYSSYDFIVKSIYVLNGDSKLADVRNKYNLDNSLYKLETSLYKSTILNITNIFFLIIYPLIILLFSINIKKRAE